MRLRYCDIFYLDLTIILIICNPFSSKVSTSAFDSAWRNSFESNLNDAAFPEKGPLWR